MTVQQVTQFAFWRETYGGATVTVYVGETQTLASLFYDTALTQPATNPQVLDSKSENGRNYGKFSAPLYLDGSYHLEITGQHVDGVTYPALTTLAGADASEALVTSERSTFAAELEDLVDEGEILIGRFGVLDTDAGSNTTLINTAIGVATGQGGGIVRLPGGTWPIDPLTVPQRVILAGAGKAATVLQCSQAAAVITIGGNDAGLASLTVDGMTLPASSRGVYAEKRDRLVLTDVKLTRYEKGIYCRGGHRHRYSGLDLVNCTTGGEFEADEDQAESDEFRDLDWSGGEVSACVTDGVLFTEVSGICGDVHLRGLFFDLNAATGLHIKGAKRIDTDALIFEQHVGDAIWIEDAQPAGGDRPVQNVTFRGLRVAGGALAQSGDIKLDGTCQAVRIVAGLLDGVRFEVVNPRDQISLVDTVANYTVLGDESRIHIERRVINGHASLATTGNVATRAWALHLVPGQAFVGYVKIVANGLTIDGYAGYMRRVVARRPCSVLDYDGKASAFTEGQIVTGASSGATGLIVDNTDNGADGTLLIRQVVGDFEDNEQITDPAGGDAIADGSQQNPNPVAVGVDNGVQSFESGGVSPLTVDVVGTNEEVEVEVTGLAGETFEWTVSIEGELST